MATPRELDNGILDSLSAHIAVLDHSGKIVAVNDAWSRFAAANGQPGDEAVGIGANYIGVCRGAASAGDKAAAEALEGIVAVLEGDRPSFRMEYPCHAPDEFRWFLLSVTTLADRDGAVVAHEDITVRRFAELALHDSHEKLERQVKERTKELEQANKLLQIENAQRCAAEASLQQAATVFESANEAIIIADAACKVLAVNRAFVRISGYETDEVLGIDFSLLWPEKHRTEFSHDIATALREQGQWQGETLKLRKNGDLYPVLESISRVSDEEGNTVSYVTTFSDISAIKDAEARLRELAHHDVLTGLANRLQFNSQLDAAIRRSRRHKRRFALLFLDLDRFKIVNDTLSHATGDRLLKSVASRLQTLVRGEDTVARWGGDEFIVIAEELAQAEDAALLAEKIHASLATPIEIGDDTISATVSIGISLFPDDATDSADLVKMADSAMYHAKETGRNKYQFYRAEFTTKAAQYLTLQTELRRAIEQQAFELHYQPQIALENGRVDGFEALLRWRHPQQGLRLPDSFLHFAEESGLIQPIGEWVLRTACEQIRAWQKDGRRPVRIGVNISGRELLHGNLADRIAEIVEQSGLTTDELKLDLEITESLQQAGKAVVQALHGLRDIGLSLSIDDFGKGYSSLSLLRHLPVDRLKIDKSFIAEIPESPESCSVVRAILALGRGLRMRIVAEGVETKEQLQFLSDNGCEVAQGYYLGRPVNAAAAAALLT